MFLSEKWSGSSHLLLVFLIHTQLHDHTLYHHYTTHHLYFCIYFVLREKKNNNNSSFQPHGQATVGVENANSWKPSGIYLFIYFKGNQVLSLLYLMERGIHS